MKNPVLKRLERNNELITAYGGLHYIKGNSAPYFSLTGEVQEKRNGRWCWVSGGCLHEILVKTFPRLADLAALHMSDNNGAPMYAVENGFYHLGGTHWERPKYDIAANHFRISEDDARALVRDLFGIHFSETGGFLASGPAKEAKARLSQWVDSQRPRWKMEADACVAKHGLVVYGDPWPAVA